jgi:hypothetical protein
VGIAAKPLAGTFDLISQTADGIKNTTTYFSDNTRERVRPPRYIGEDHVLTPFSKKKSEGKLMLCYLDDQSHQDENYLWHVEGQVRGTRHILLCTDKSVYFINAEDSKKSIWMFPLRGLDRCEVIQGNLVIYLSQSASANIFEAATTLGAGADRRVVPFGLPQADIAQKKLTDTKIKLSHTWSRSNRPLKLSWKKSDL